MFGRSRRLTTLERIAFIVFFVACIARAAVYWLDRLTF
jgi:hypothetical protein